MIDRKKVDSLRRSMIRMQTVREDNATMGPDETTKNLSRRDPITTTATAEGATDSSGPGTRRSSENLSPSWDLVVDIVVVGAGATGLPAAIKAVDGGASVIVVETNYDIGGDAGNSSGHNPLARVADPHRQHW